MISNKLILVTCLIILAGIIVFFSCEAKNNCNSVQRFRGTKSWKLAKAVCSQNIDLIKSILKKDPFLLDFKEPQFGSTLLMLCVKNNLLNSAEILLSLGANPNIPDNYNGTTALIMASGFGQDYSTDTEMLTLLLNYGGDLNMSEQGVRREGNWTRKSPLQRAAACCLNKVKILVEAGADINDMNEFNISAITSCLYGASKDQAEILKYFVIEQKANIDIPVKFNQYEKKSVYIEEALRRWTFPLDSRDYQIKMEVVEYLKEKGRDYYKTEIPSKYYNRFDEEYLSKY